MQSRVGETPSGDTAIPTGVDEYESITLHMLPEQPAPPLNSGAATPPFPQAGKDTLQRPIPDAVPPRSPAPAGKGLILSGLTRVTDVIYGEVPSSMHVAPVPHQKAPKPVLKIKSAFYKVKHKVKPAPPKVQPVSTNGSSKPPLHPRTISMSQLQLDSGSIIAGHQAATPRDSLTQSYPLPGQGKVKLQSVLEVGSVPLGKPTIAAKPAHLQTCVHEKCQRINLVRPSASDGAFRLTTTLSAADGNGVNENENRPLRCKIDNSIVTKQDSSKTESDLPSTGTSDTLCEDATISERVERNSPPPERRVGSSFLSGRREGGGDCFQWRPLISTRDDDDDLYDDIIIAEMQKSATKDSNRDFPQNYIDYKPQTELSSTEDSNRNIPQDYADFKPQAELEVCVPLDYTGFKPQAVPDKPLPIASMSDNDDLYDDIIVKKQLEPCAEEDIREDNVAIDCESNIPDKLPEVIELGNSLYVYDDFIVTGMQQQRSTLPGAAAMAISVPDKLPEVTEPGNSDDDLYDDIIVPGMQQQRSTLPGAAAMAISVVGASSQSNPAAATGGAMGLSHVDSAQATDQDASDDDSASNAEILEQKLAELNSPDDSITAADRDSSQPQILMTGASIRPMVPEKPSDIHLHPKVVEMRFLKKQKQLQEITEIYDLSPDNTTDSEVEEIYLSSVDMEDSEDGPWSGQSAEKGSSRREKGVELPVKSGRVSAAGIDQSDEEVEGARAYEELVIYEELKERDNGYQDIEQARIDALGLPQVIRRRSARLVKGKERKRLRKSIKYFSKGSAGKATFDPPMAQDVTASAGDVQDSVPEPELVATISPESSSGEDDTHHHDGYMSHDKARQVLDMLLEANNVIKLAHGGKLLTVQDERREPLEKDSHNIITDNSVTLPDPILPAGIEEYQRAGILKSKSTQEIAAEIKFLTDSAPKEPPPLPGVQRQRAEMVSRSDDQIRTRKRLIKTNTFPTFEYT